MTSIRWKPQTTYRSPTAGTSTLHLEVRVVGSDTSSSSSSKTPSPQALPLQLSPPSTIYQSSQSSKRHKRWMTGPSLPLYHPLGRLALSLPDLDPTVFGLPAPAVIIDDPTRRSSNRARRPAPKVRDANEPAPSPAPSVDAVPEPSPEPKDKPVPRRRRHAGSGNKRRRREVDDGDATYPAKRTRMPRSSAATTPTGREASPLHSLDNSAASNAGDQGGPERPERRTAKSRGSRARKDSTASEGTVTSVSASIAAANATSNKNVGENGLDVDVSLHSGPQDPILANSGRTLGTSLDESDINHGPG